MTIKLIKFQTFFSWSDQLHSVIVLHMQPVKELVLPKVTSAVSVSPVNSLFIVSSIVLPEVYILTNIWKCNHEQNIINGEIELVWACLLSCIVQTSFSSEGNFAC